MKLLDTLSYGVPFLATNFVAHQVDDPSKIFPCLFSDDPLDWILRIEQYQDGEINLKFRKHLLDYAQQNSWDMVAEKYMQNLENLGY